ncbi:MAG: 16S rRNA (uracil(1498)-N(3))-methyltransferase [Caulobacteraceae bacterium]|nr:16S rRNA (uracil(1498)-N(3))-methyltransferase [Caulobacteraceae bacterium]
MIRLFVTHDLSAGARLGLDPDQSRYLAAVMRLAVGDALAVFNGRDGEWAARVAAAGKKSVELEVGERLRAQAAPPDLELVIALVKRARLETIVEKAAELGCARVRLALTERTQADHTRVERLAAIAVEAAEQTGRLDAPAIEAPEKLERILAAWDPARRQLFCYEAGDAPPILGALNPSPLAGEGGLRSRSDEGSHQPVSFESAVAPNPAHTPIDPSSVGHAPDTFSRKGRRGPEAAQPWAILIGPEGGFSPREREILRDQPFTTACSLGPRILRADTAAIAALALWQAALGDWTP